MKQVNLKWTDTSDRHIYKQTEYNFINLFQEIKYTDRQADRYTEANMYIKTARQMNLQRQTDI